jgi:uncharacterized protein (DUF2235 family)
MVVSRHFARERNVIPCAVFIVKERTMPKNIILLSDGTGNSASKLFKTNVWRLYQALDLSEAGPSAPGSRKQIAYYDDGVGTASFKPLAIFGGAFGWGTKRNVLDLYTFLCRNYEPGDCIYGFGFSRGAFTIRVLTGLISSQGLVKTETEGELRQLAADAFRTYREERYKHYKFLRYVVRPLRNLILMLWYKITGRKTYDPGKNIRSPKITFLGLWDTVAAYGLPIDELTHAWNFIFPLSFPDRKLSDIVECAYHALAIDDERLSFHPELWNECPSDYKSVPLGNRLNQVWFVGMHSNIGGGYPDDALSGVPLNWILDKSEQVGMSFLQHERNRLRESACVKGKMYDSRQGLGGAYRYMPRKINALTHDDVNNEQNRVVIDIPKIHESVLMRISKRVDGYAPIGLPEKYEVVGSSGLLKNRMESPAQAKDRSNRQQKIWNLVWLKRIVYFISVAIFVLLAAFPLYRPATARYDGPLYILSGVIGSIGAFLPDFLSFWFRAYQSHPGLFILIAGVFAAVLYLASRLQVRIFDKMRVIFDNPIPASSTVTNSPRDAIYILRSNPLIRLPFKWMKEKLIPWAILVIVAMFILRGIFTVMDSAGLISTPTMGGLKSELKDGNFNSDNLSWASGVRVEEGKRYRITLAVNGEGQDAWRDKTINATPVGLKRQDIVPVMYLALPLRRHITEPWFKPIARIGEYGNDEYPLDPADGSDSNTLISEIKARRSGELFLFVNDAVLPVPKSWQIFYDNNGGTANVKVEPLD